MLVNAVPGRNGKAADPVIFRQDEVGQAHIGPPFPLTDLLAKEWHADHLARGWLYQHVIAFTPARPEGSYSFCRHPFFDNHRSEEHTSELQSLMRNSYAVFCLKKKTNTQIPTI